MQTIAIQCDVKGCTEKCSDQDREQPRIPDAPPPRTAEWVYLRMSTDSGDRWLCPGHALVLRALFAGRIELNITASIPDMCSVCNEPRIRKPAAHTANDTTKHPGADCPDPCPYCAAWRAKRDTATLSTAAEKDAYRGALYEGQTLAMGSLIEHLESLKTQAEGVAALWEKSDVTPKEAYRQGLDDALTSVMQAARALLLVAKKGAPPGV